MLSANHAALLVLVVLVALEGLLVLRMLLPQLPQDPMDPLWRGCLENTKAHGFGLWCSLPDGHAGRCELHSERRDPPTNLRAYRNARDAWRGWSWVEND